MAKFFYKALKEDKREFVSGYIEAKTASEARIKVQQLGFSPTGIYEETFSSAGKNQNKSSHINKKLRLTEKIYFTSELQMLLESGISPIEALETIGQYAPGKNVGFISLDLAKRIKEGQTFSEALSVYEKTFGNVYLALSKTGEESGAMPSTLLYLVNLLKKQDTLKGKFIQMSIYPCILIFIMIAMFFGFGGIIFPKFVTEFNLEMSQVPILAKCLIDSVSFTINNWWIMLLIAFSSWLGVNLLFGTDTVKRKISQFLISLPGIGICIRYLSLSHYMTVLHVAYESGVPIVTSLELAKETVYNHVIRDEAGEVINMLEKGNMLTEALNKSKLLPPVFLSLIATGEKTGKLGKMFRDISLGVEQKLDTAIGALSKSFEPLLLIIIGLGVAYLILCLFQIYMTAVSSIL